MTRSPPRSITPARGIRAHLRNKAASRRETQAALTSIAGHTPRPRNDLLPDLTIVQLPLDSLKPAPRRVRRADKAQAARLDGSIGQYGFVQPILIDAERTILHGHGIWEAARRAGLARVPTITISHLTPAELKGLPIALNRLGETGVWDEEALRVELGELFEIHDEPIVTGFDPAEIDFLLLDEDEGEEADEGDQLAPLNSEPVSRMGDLWALGEHRLVQGDARDPGAYELLMCVGERARIVLSDIPFNVPNKGHVTGQAHHREFAMAHGEMSREEFAAFNTAWMRACLAWLIDGGLLSTFIDWRSIELVLACARELGLDLVNVVVWSKSNGGQGSLWRSQHELLPVFKWGAAPHVNNVQLGRHGRWRSNVWSYPGASSLGSDARAALGDHPTVKPRALLEDALLDVTHRGEIVVDRFLGSGSTLLAAESTGRVGRAIEIDAIYCDLAIRRWEALTGARAVLASTGETHAEVEERRAAEALATGNEEER